ncbi:MAG: response regulator [Nitrospirota bacterium]|nr:response regulator [Nitrospirota bacterium]
MFKVLIADDDYEDRELLKLEIKRALGDEEPDIRFYEAVSVKKALQLLTAQIFDLMTLDIEFDRMTEGIDALPGIFENHPTLNIIVISGKLNKGEVSEQLFRFTKDNVLKGKRWARHFDVLDKKDDKTEALRRAYSFATKQREGTEKLRELFLLAESYIEKDMIDKCVEVYQKIQGLVPDELESRENINIFKGGLSADYALEYFRKGEKVIASLLLGHYIEKQLKTYTATVLGGAFPSLSDCLKALEQSGRLSQTKKGKFQLLLRLRNKAIHQPAEAEEADFSLAKKKLKSLEETLV